MSLSLLDSSGKPAPLQLNPLARWSDGSVKWMLLDFILGPVVSSETVWSLQLRQDKPQEVDRPGKSFRVTETDRAIVVQTGAAKFTLDRHILAPLAQVEIANTPVLDTANTRTVLVDAKGRICHPRIERSEIETSGSVRATVRFQGSFDGRRRKRLRFRARLSFFAGSSLARVELTLHNPHRARHRGGLWDLGDPGSLFFRDLSLQLALAGPGARQVQWTENVDDRLKSAECERFEIYQDSSGGENWQSRNHVNRLGRVPSQFRGYRVRHDEIESYSLRASPIVSLSADGKCITAGMPEFWQQFPKAIDVGDGRLNLRLFPCQYGDPYELQGGEQKTHTVWLHFGQGDQAGLDSLSWVHRPVRVHCTPEWYSTTEVIPYLLPASTDPNDRFESFTSTVVDGPNSFFFRREIIDEYGWRNFGEVYADHEAQHYEGPAPVISHYNNQYDLVNGLLLQYLRTGDADWFKLSDVLARHVIDIDIYHTTEDKAAYNGGMFWHTNHYRDAATSTHRAYSHYNYRPGDPFAGGGPSSNHNYSTGLLHYHYITGDPNARETVIGLADWVVNMDDGEQSVFGILDPSPTGNATYPGEPNYQGPCRGAGNSINALIDGWLLTGRRAYLDKAGSLIRRVSHPYDDIPARDLLNVEPRWSYTVFLSSVSRYLSVNAEAGQLDFMYAYAQTVLLRYAEWMVDHERPYFDQVEKLEFPNETWAAQDFRKANVLRLAAAHEEEPMRSALLRRGAELAKCAWYNLLRFDSRHTARAVALLLVEGHRDACFRHQDGAPAPRVARTYDFKVAEQFVPQKERVLAELRTVRGIVRALIKLADARNWPLIRLRGLL